jgi:hypothetical protein
MNNGGEEDDGPFAVEFYRGAEDDDFSLWSFSHYKCGKNGGYYLLRLIYHEYRGPLYI